MFANSNYPSGYHQLNSFNGTDKIDNKKYIPLSRNCYIFFISFTQSALTLFYKYSIQFVFYDLRMMQQIFQNQIFSSKNVTLLTSMFICTFSNIGFYLLFHSGSIFTSNFSVFSVFNVFKFPHVHGLDWFL